MTKTNNDRTVFVRGSHLVRVELVRYDRAGKWRLEHSLGSLLPSYGMNLTAAVEWTVGALTKSYLNVEVFWDQPGGRVFYSRLNRKLNEMGWRVSKSKYCFTTLKE